MKIDTLALFEFFEEIVCAAADQAPHNSNFPNPDKNDSFFSDVEEDMIQNSSMCDLLHGHDNLLKTLAENWKKEIDKPWQILFHIDDFIIANEEYFKRSKIKVRTILDYVYTVV